MKNNKKQYPNSYLNIALSISIFWLLQLSIFLALYISPDSFQLWRFGMGHYYSLGIDLSKIINYMLLTQALGLIIPPIIAKLIFKDNKYIGQSFLVCFIQAALLNTIIGIVVNSDVSLFGNNINIM